MKYFLFDLDGTLLDSEQAIVHLYQEELPRMGLKKPDANMVLAESGKTAGEWVLALNPSIPEADVGRIAETVRRAFAYKYLPRYGKPYAESHDILTELRRKGAGIGAVTNQKRFEAEVSFKVMNFDFDVTACRDDVAHAKPAPDLVFEGLRRLGAKKEEALFVGDSFADAGAGKAAGVRTLLVKRFWNKEVNAEKIDSLSEVLKFL